MSWPAWSLNHLNQDHIPVEDEFQVAKPVLHECNPRFLHQFILRFLLSCLFHYLGPFPKRFKVLMPPVSLLVFVMCLGSYHAPVSRVCFSHLGSHMFSRFCCSIFSLCRCPLLCHMLSFQKFRWLELSSFM